MWRIRRRILRKRASSVTKHYQENKEAARAVILERLDYFNQFYGLTWNRVAIRNQRRCWGSCSSQKNLNFSYKLMYLPDNLRDYIVVHELCHLKELHHGRAFWELVAVALPNYQELVRELKQVEKNGVSAVSLQEYKNRAAVVSPLQRDTT